MLLISVPVIPVNRIISPVVSKLTLSTNVRILSEFDNVIVGLDAGVKRNECVPTSNVVSSMSELSTPEVPHLARARASNMSIRRPCSTAVVVIVWCNSADVVSAPGKLA